MTEQEWLASTDPAAMLAWLAEAHKPAALRAAMPSDRRLRLFAVACCRQVFHLLADERSRKAVESWEQWADGGLPRDHARHRVLVEAGSAYDEAVHTYGQTGWTTRRVGHPKVLAAVAAHNLNWHNANSHNSVVQVALDVASAGPGNAFIANVLRDLVGNPWRPVTWPYVPDGRPAEGVAVNGRLVRRVEGSPHLYESADRCPWLTPTVVALAQTAYDERPGLGDNAPMLCPTCRATGHVHTDYPFGRESCPTCHGTGTIADGRLDPERLLVLADALEEAGCPTEESYTETATPHSECPQCGKPGRWRRGVGFDHERICTGERCWTSWQPGEAVEVRRKRPLLLLAHLRSPGPHWRGCWALDLLLGKA